MKFLPEILILLLIIIGWCVYFIPKMSRSWRVEIAPSVHSSGKIAIRIKKGEQVQTLKLIDPADPDFDQQLYEATLEADQKVLALNSTRR